MQPEEGKKIRGLRIYRELAEEYTTRPAQHIEELEAVCVKEIWDSGYVVNFCTQFRSYYSVKKLSTDLQNAKEISHLVSACMEKDKRLSDSQRISQTAYEMIGQRSYDWEPNYSMLSGRDQTLSIFSERIKIFEILVRRQQFDSECSRERIDHIKSKYHYFDTLFLR
ncbi:5462_t:CDS:2 [Paraglomus brasilianum]|uniref:5462_t:CDS:1 n=1 Tax=Paraglomus brasilianum TaxID=144538 RepID=A0A9N8VHH2_9GLOM|nr:5462_t:CDS:2 [Paraglomus brasilianum]